MNIYSPTTAKRTNHVNRICAFCCSGEYKRLTARKLKVFGLFFVYRV